MKKILFMITSMNIGGVEKSLLSLLSIIPKDKYDITLLVLEKKGGFLEFVPSWVKIEEATWFKEVKPIIMQPPQQTIRDYIKNKKYTKILPFIFSYMVDKYFDNRYKYYRQVFKSVPDNQQEYDVAIAYQGPTDVIDYYITHKVKARKKISWVHFDVSKHCFNKKLYKRLYDKYNNIFVVSKEAKEKLIEEVPTVREKTEVFLNIVSKDMIREMAEEKIDFDDSFKGTKIVTVGRLSKEKGQDLAIGTLKKLRDDGYNARWYCIGDGNSKIEYEKLIKNYNLQDDFILLGAKTNPYPYIKNADIYVQTSRHEGYCLTLAEAKCLEKTILTTNFIGAYGQIQDGINGYICNCEVDDLYRKIRELIDIG